MANKQSVPYASRGDNHLQQLIRPVAVQPKNQNEDVDESVFSDVKTLMNSGAKILLHREKLIDENMRLKAASALKAERQQLENSENPQAFDEIIKATPTYLKAQFQDEDGQKFWNEHGQQILQAHQKDVQKIKDMKAKDFGRGSLDDMLAQSQNMLATEAENNGDLLLQRGLEAINQVDFLSDDEKNNYRNEYLKNGILNMALQNAEMAENKRAVYFNDDAKMQSEIDEIRRLKEADLRKQEDKKRRDNYLQKLSNHLALWQNKERGEIDEASYYVMTFGDDDDLLWGERDTSNNYPMKNAYLLMRRFNRGEELSEKEIRDAGNYLIKAYKQHQINLDETSVWQNLFVGAQQNGSFTRDITADELTDKVLGKDSIKQNKFADAYTEYKAKMAFAINEAYFQKKQSLIDEFLKNGGVMTLAEQKKIQRDAVQYVTDVLQLKPSETEVEFDDLYQVLQNAYNGGNKDEIWKKFATQAPYYDNKRELMRKLATEQERKEAKLPSFETLDELYAAHLDVGDQFYFKGRLAVKS